MTARCQQDELYAAEAGVSTGAHLASQADAQAWIDERLVDQPWWPERFPKVRLIRCPTVSRRSGEGSVGHWYEDDHTGVVEMAPIHLNERTLCHEVAHVCTASEGGHAHGPLFARIYCELVYRVMGTEVWLDLRSRLLEAGVVIDERDDT